MSIPAAKNAMIGGPLALAAFNTRNTTALQPLIEGSPIYTALELTYAINGTSSSGGIDYNYNYTKTTTFSRVTHREAIDGAIIARLQAEQGVFYGWGVTGTGYLPGLVSLDVVPTLAPPAASFTCHLFAGMIWVLAESPPYAYSELNTAFDPRKQMPIFLGPDLSTTGIFLLEAGAVVGTQTDNNPFPPVTTDIIEDVFGYTPIASYSPPMGGLCHISPSGYDMFGTVTDITGWTEPQWRDWRGTYTATQTPMSGVTATATCVIS
jgi:hypothetical protein